MVRKILQVDIMEAIKGRTAEEALSISKTLTQSLAVNPALQKRLANANPHHVHSEIRFFDALRKPWVSGGDEFRFDLTSEFSKDESGVQYNWSGHTGMVVDNDVGLKDSKPQKLFNVFRRDPESNTLVKLPLNVGCTIKPPKRVGVVDNRVPLFQRTDGKEANLTIISAFVQAPEEHKVKVLREVNGRVTYVEKGRAEIDLRGKVETALIALLYSQGADAVFSSILFNMRDNPLNGMRLAMSGLYGKKDFMVLPANGQYLSGKRARQREIGKNARDKIDNGVIFVAYVNGETIDLSKFPKLDMSAFIGAELLESSRLVDHANKAYKEAKDAGTLTRDIEGQVKHADDVIGQWFGLYSRFLDASYGIGPIYSVAKDGLADRLPKSVLEPVALSEIIKTRGRNCFSTAMHALAEIPNRGGIISAVAESAIYQLEVAKVKFPEAFVSTLSDTPEWDMPSTLRNLADCGAEIHLNATGVLERDKLIKRVLSLKKQMKEIPHVLGIDNVLYKLTYFPDGPRKGFGYYSADGKSISSAGKKSQLHELPKTSFTVETLLSLDHNRRAPIHIMAKKGLLSFIPPAVLDCGMLTLPDKTGRSALYYAAENGYLSQLPSASSILNSPHRFKDCTPMLTMNLLCSRKYIPPELASKSDVCYALPGMWSVVEVAAFSGALNQIPNDIINAVLATPETRNRLVLSAALGLGDSLKHIEKLCTPSRLLKQGPNGSVLHVAAAHGAISKFQKDLISESSVLVPNSTQETVLHVAAKFGSLKEFPKEVLTQASLESLDRLQESYAHVAAKYGFLDQIPTDLLTATVLDNCNVYGETVISEAVRNGYMLQVPKEFLTEERLLRKNTRSSTPLHWVGYYGQLCHVPKGLLTLETMLLKDTHGNTPLRYTATEGHLDQLLGIDFGENEEAKEIVGEQWWSKHLDVLRQKELELCKEAPEVDLF